MEKKIIYLNEKPFELTLPTGGNAPEVSVTENEWDRVLVSGCYFNSDMNGVCVGSWCHERPIASPTDYVVRGRFTPGNWGYDYDDTQSVMIGYRPVLLPLDADTLQFDSTLLQYLNGSTVRMGVFAVNDKVLTAPYNYVYQVGDVVVLRGDIGYKDKAIEWAVFDGKLISVYNLMVNVSRNQLIELGLVAGNKPKELKNVLDGHIRGEYIGSNYVLITVPTIQNYKKWESKDKDGFSIIAVNSKYLLKYATEGGYANLEDYFNRYNIEEEVYLEYCARKEDAIAFTYRPNCENKLRLGESMDDEKLWVMTEFLSKYLNQWIMKNLG